MRYNSESLGPQREKVMEITRERVNKLVRNYGPVSVYDSTGTVQPLKDGNPDSWALIEKADRFHFAGQWHTRQQFQKLLDMYEDRPGSVTQIDLP